MHEIGCRSRRRLDVRAATRTLFVMEELSEVRAFLILNALPNIGPITTNRLLERFGGEARRIFSSDAKRLQEVRGVGPAVADTILNWRTFFDLEREERNVATAEAVFVHSRAENYPSALREIYDPPIGFYQKGSYDWSRPAVGVVGSRKTTLYGLATAKRFAAELARAGFCVVSGLARGIDTAAHEGALEAEGATVAVLGNGVDIIYPPENLALYRRIVQAGAVISEFPLGRRADRQTFAMRNRIISGLSNAVIVIESDVDGGAMITAKFAGEQGRTLFAVPGRIDQATSAGCHQLIRDGAILCTSVADILDELSHLKLRISPQAAQAHAAAKTISVELTEVERQILACFAGGEMLSVDALAEQTQRGLAEISPALLSLELKRVVSRRLDGTYETA